MTVKCRSNLCHIQSFYPSLYLFNVSDILPVSLLLTLNIFNLCSCVSVVDLEQINAVRKRLVLICLGAVQTSITFFIFKEQFLLVTFKPFYHCAVQCSFIELVAKVNA